MNVELKNRGFSIGIYKIAALMKEAKVVALTPKNSIIIQIMVRNVVTL